MYGQRRIFSKDGGFNFVDGDRLLKGYRRDGIDEVEFENMVPENTKQKFQFGGIGAESSTESYYTGYNKDTSQENMNPDNCGKSSSSTPPTPPQLNTLDEGGSDTVNSN